MVAEWRPSQIGLQGQFFNRITWCVVQGWITEGYWWGEIQWMAFTCGLGAFENVEKYGLLGLSSLASGQEGMQTPLPLSAVLDSCKQNTLPLPLFPSAKVSSSTTMLLHRLTCLLKVHLNGMNFHLFPRIVVTRKRRTNSTFWHHFWAGFESSFPKHFPNWKSDNFCGF